MPTTLLNISGTFLCGTNTNETCQRLFMTTQAPKTISESIVKQLVKV